MSHFSDHIMNSLIGFGEPILEDGKLKGFDSSVSDRLRVDFWTKEVPENYRQAYTVKAYEVYATLPHDPADTLKDRFIESLRKVLFKELESMWKVKI